MRHAYFICFLPYKTGGLSLAVLAGMTIPAGTSTPRGPRELKFPDTGSRVFPKPVELKVPGTSHQHDASALLHSLTQQKGEDFQA